MRPAHITPSGFAKIMANGRGSDSLGKTALAYVDELVMEILGVGKDEIITYEMQRGIDLEPEAIRAYEDATMGQVSDKQRIVHPEYDFVSGEPDGLVGENGLIEIKCPARHHHLANLIDGQQISLYMCQMQGYMWITGRDWCDFVSYDPRFPAPLEIAIHRIPRNEDMIEKLEKRCVQVWELVEQRLQEINQLIQE